MATGEITIPIALVHTAIAMGTVFAVLILISFVIWLLKFVPKILNGASKGSTKEKKESPQAKQVVQIPQAPPKKATDAEIVAVIAAAIAEAMSEETGVPVSPEGLVIRSIKKRSFN